MLRIFPILLALFLLPITTGAEHGDHIVIGEILIEGSAAKDEYVELYNPTAADVNLENWKLVKATGSGNESNLVGAFPSGIIPAHGSLLVCAPEAATCVGRVDVVYTTSNSLAINNSVTLKNADGVVIDRVGWGEATIREGGAAPNPIENQSLERKPGSENGNGQDTDDNANDFQFATPTPQNKNVAARPTLSAPAQPAAPPAPSGSAATIPPAAPRQPTIKIKLNELYPNPPQSDFDEFIELKNESEITVDLAGWILKDPNGVTYTLGRADVAPGGLFVMTRQTSGLALRNGGGKVELLDKNEKREDGVSYDGPVEESIAYARDENGKWKWTTKPTPNTMNEIVTPNRPPVAQINIEGKLEVGKPITLDASDSNDPDGDPLTFMWILPDGATRTGSRLTLTQLIPAKLTIILTVRDDHGHEIKLERKLTIGSMASEPIATPRVEVRFSEILPNPEGRDTGEWLELENQSTRAVSLAGFRLVAGERSHELPEGVAISARGFVILAGPALGLPLKNAGGALTFQDQNRTILDTLAYPKLEENTSYARTPAGTWAQTSVTTPGAMNLIQVSPEKTTTKKELSLIRDISPEEIWDLPVNTRIRFEGTVTTPLGIVGTTRFTVAGAILETRQAIPQLKEGDRIRGEGTIRDRSGVRVVYIGKQDSVLVVGHTKLPSPTSFHPEEANVDQIGTLVKLEGVVMTRRGRNLTLKTDEQEVNVVLPETLGEKFSKDTPVTLTGILTHTTKGWRIVTRTAHDITLAPTAESYKPEAISPATPFTIPLRQRPPTMTLIFLASLIGLGLVGIGLWIYERPRPILQPIYAPGEPLTPHVETFEIPLEDERKA